MTLLMHTWLWEIIQVGTSFHIDNIDLLALLYAVDHSHEVYPYWASSQRA